MSLRRLIKWSHLKYLSPERRRTVLEMSKSLEFSEINDKVACILEWKDIRDYSCTSESKSYINRLLASNLCTSFSELEDLMFNDITWLFFKIPHNVMKAMLWFCKTSSDFIKLCDLEVIIHMMYKDNIENITVLSSICDSLTELQNLLQNPKIAYLLVYSEYENITFLFNHIGITNINDLNKVIEDWKWEHLKKLLKNWDTEDISSLLSLEQKWEHLILPDWSISFTKEPWIWTCNDSEVFHKEVLLWSLPNTYVQIVYKQDMIWYIKKLWQPSFLAIRDIFSESGTLLLRKWMIYAVTDSRDTSAEKMSHTNTEYEEIKVNPKRMVKIPDLDTLLQNFKDNVTIS